MPSYFCHGLRISSDVELKGLQTLEQPRGKNPVHIARGQVPSALDFPTKTRRYYAVSSGKAMLCAPGVGRLLIQSGSKITYALDDGCDSDLLSSHIVGSGLAIANHQRGNIVLHASTLCRGGHAYLVCGKSGAGKSTTVAHLLENGGSTIGDDVAAISDAQDPYVYLGPATTKLSRDSLAKLPMHRGFECVGRCVSDKSILSTRQQFSEQAAKLGAIFELVPTDCETASIERLGVRSAMMMLQVQTFRKRLIDDKSASTLFAKWAILAKNTNAYRIQRPKRGSTIFDVVKLIEQTISETTNV